MRIVNPRHAIVQDGNIPVILQDQSSPALVIPMLQSLVSTTLAVQAVMNAYTFVVTSAVGLTVGTHCRVIDPGNNRFYQGIILGIVGTSVAVDTPIDFAYPAGVEFATGNSNMAVNGSVTPIVFKLRIGATSVPGTADITRMIMTCETNDPVNLDRFGDIAGGLTRGLVFRLRNGVTQNIFNAKANKELAGIAYDFTPYTASNPALGINGFAWRLTFNGQEKIGVVLRVAQNDNLEIWVQDDLSSLVSLSVILEGHAVVEQ